MTITHQTLPVSGPGIYRMTADEYHADPCPEPSISSSIAKVFLAKSPIHAWTASPRLNPNWEPKDSKTFDIGRAAHRAILGAGGDFVAIPEDILGSNGAASTKEAKAFIAAARESGLTPLKQIEVDQVNAMRDVAASRLADFGIEIDPDRSELVAIAVIDGVWCRAMMDNVPVDPRLPIRDLKTCESAAPDDIKRSMENYDYSLSVAHYTEVWAAATGEKRDFEFIFQEKPAPHEIAVARLMNNAGHSEDWMQDAAEAMARVRAGWRKCLDTGMWNGYPRQIIEIGASQYYRNRVQERALRLGSIEGETA